MRQAKSESEDAKVGIRSARQDANKELKKLDISEDVLKNNETDIQDLTDRYTKKIEQAFQSKESEIMKV